MIPKRLFLFLTFLAAIQYLQAQSWLLPADTLNKGRFYTCVAGGAATYAAFSVGLYNTWYKDYELVGFHTFNDGGEWMQMDKAGHFLTTFTETRLLYSGARWTGMKPRASAWTAFAVANFLQGTLETMDGFSSKWGFSWWDAGFNLMGSGLFTAQQLAWDEQRILVKASSTYRPHYSNEPLISLDGNVQTSVLSRADDLYGYSLAESFLKDYNALTVWASVNVRSFAAEDSKWPAWLNVAVGYGAENLFGGFANDWEDDNGAKFSLDTDLYPRYRQFYLSPDIDLSRLPVRSRFVKALLGIANFIKIPAPALEVNTLGKVKLHALFW